MAGETAFVAAWTATDTPPTSLAAAHAFALDSLGWGRPLHAAPVLPQASAPLLDFLGPLAMGGGDPFDPPSRTSPAAAAAWAGLRVVAAHPASCPPWAATRAFLLELAGWEGEAFVLVKCPDDFSYEGANALEVSLWVRVAESEVMG